MTSEERLPDVPAPLPPSRRDVLAAGGLALGALAGGAATRFGWAQEEGPAGGTGPLERLIVLWMAGGPSQIDTFDPKPGRPTGGPFGTVATAVDGLAFAEHLPQLAQVAGDLAVVRSLTSKEGAHERAVRLLQTGYPPSATVDHPHVGTWIARRRGEPESGLPGFVSLGVCEGSGFLGADLAPFVVTDVNRPVQDLAPRVGPARQSRREALLDALGASFPGREEEPVAAAQRAARERARRLMASPAVKAFDLSDEPETVHQAYGQSAFGKACLLARRLVEADVRVVHVTLGGWDHHRQAFPALQRLLGQVDPAFARLVRDLKERGLLDSTCVLWMGEFGRTPKINATEGRDHYPAAFSAVLAGGGVPGGQAIGRTDDDGAKVVEDPFEPAQLLASVLTLAGVDPGEKVFADTGRPIWPVPKDTLPIDALLPPRLRRGAPPEKDRS